LPERFAGRWHLGKGFRALISLVNLSKDKDMPLQVSRGRPTSSRSGGDERGDVHSLAMVERWFRPTGTAALIAKIEP
jgi:hypothetical protein